MSNTESNFLANKIKSDDEKKEERKKNCSSYTMSNTRQISDGLQAPLIYDNSDTISSNRNNVQTNNQNGKSPAAANNNHQGIATQTTTTTTINAKDARPVPVFMKLKTYLFALRPWSLSASLVPTLLGSALAYRSSTPHEFNFLTFLLTIFTVVTVHGAGNVVNTYYDYVKGIDNRKSDDRTLVDHILSEDEVNTLQITLFS